MATMGAMKVAMMALMLAMAGMGKKRVKSVTATVKPPV